MAQCPFDQVEAPGPSTCSRLVLVTELEVGVESKEIKFMSRDQPGLRH